ncbi:hypothetical protein DID88_002384 [Monilinia fructigena]|uniref:Nucleoporin Nup54 alpha-helical domain-containing protein n=1 Tax=Monilinia fructigena TaxID=38457 RepID=A0A395II83_9HELO|nr:hypothetical protein DID88_002384 [Monilinia fructigena]
MVCRKYPDHRAVCCIRLNLSRSLPLTPRKAYYIDRIQFPCATARLDSNLAKSLLETRRTDGWAIVYSPSIKRPWEDDTKPPAQQNGGCEGWHGGTLPRIEAGSFSQNPVSRNPKDWATQNSQYTQNKGGSVAKRVHYEGNDHNAMSRVDLDAPGEMPPSQIYYTNRYDHKGSTQSASTFGQIPPVTASGRDKTLKTNKNQQPQAGGLFGGGLGAKYSNKISRKQGDFWIKRPTTAAPTGGLFSGQTMGAQQQAPSSTKQLLGGSQQQTGLFGQTQQSQALGNHKDNLANTLFGASGLRPREKSVVDQIETVIDRKGASDPALGARAEEIWARMIMFKTRPVIKDRTGKVGKKVILEDYQTQLAHLKKELDRDIKNMSNGKKSSHHKQLQEQHLAYD